MKLRIPNVAEWMLFLSVAGIVILGGFLAVRASEPPPVKFEGLEVVNAPMAGDLLIVEATVYRVEKEGCTNGVQVDSRDADGSEVRLPVPTREVSGSYTRYAIVVPVLTPPGAYELRVRETVYCSGGPRIAETPWMAFEVAG